jgi:AcrR family transcriptional regulator
MTTLAPLPVRRTPGRPRCGITHGAILDAAVELMATTDYADISIERIAAKAKVGKQSIYRWWSSRAELMLEALSERALRQASAPEPSGDALADLAEFLQRVIDTLGHPIVGKGFAALVAEAQLDAEFRRRFHDSYLVSRRQILRSILERGVADGQLRPDLDIELMIDMIHGALWYRLMSGCPRRCDPAFATDIVAVLRPSLVCREVSAACA